MRTISKENIKIISLMPLLSTCGVHFASATESDIHDADSNQHILQRLVAPLLQIVVPRPS